MKTIFVLLIGINLIARTNASKSFYMGYINDSLKVLSVDTSLNSLQNKTYTLDPVHSVKLSKFKFSTMDPLNPSINEENLKKKAVQFLVVNKSLDEILRSNLSNSQFTLERIPIYYLTPNVIDMKEGQNIAQYFREDTARFFWLVKSKQSPVGAISFNGKFAKYRPLSNYEILIFNKILELKQQPKAFITTITLEPSEIIGSIDKFGYQSIVNNHFIFLEYVNTTMTRDGHAIKEQGFSIQLAELYFLQGGRNSVLSQRLNTTVSYLEYKKR